KKILEVGCGGAQCSIAFAKKGAICTGLDISKNQLDYAEKIVKKNKVKVKLIKKDIQTLSGIKSNSFDIVFSAYALLYVPNLKKCFKEINRVLKTGGIFVFSHDSPFFLTLDAKTKKIVRSYLRTGKQEEIDFGPDGSKHKFVFYNRKLSEIYNSLVETGFFVKKILEPYYPKQKAWSRKSWREIYPPEFVKLMPPTIIFKAVKI
ncbi:MAG: class I SAM-dependent methyltransferase, partial [Nanoarchaeota archaeon]|nr:class I SAM-dependent methyltransferase [Nanoarchaeota archaeon]